MTDPETGVKDPEVTPTSDESGADASPPEVEFEDDQIQEVEGERLVPLDVAKAERQKRQALEEELKKYKEPPTEPIPEVPEGEPVPEFDWEKLMGQPNPNPDQQQFEQFNEHFQEMVENNPWGAMATAWAAFDQQKERMRQQARQFAPDYDNLPIHEITEQEVMAVAQNPHALRALLARAKGSARPHEGSEGPSATPTPAQPTDEKQRWIEEGRKQERDLLAQMAKGAGTAGEGTSGPTSTPGDVMELDEASKAYFKQRGYSDEDIAKMASKVLDERRRKGLMV